MAQCLLLQCHSLPLLPLWAIASVIREAGLEAIDLLIQLLVYILKRMNTQECWRASDVGEQWVRFLYLGVYMAFDCFTYRVCRGV